MLHPQLKLKYFQQRHWAQDWIDTAEAIVREEFEKYDTRPTLGPVLVCSNILLMLLTHLVMTVSARS